METNLKPSVSPTPAQRKQICDCTTTAKILAAQIKCSPATVHRIRKAEGGTPQPRGRRKPSPDLVAKARTLRSHGDNLTVIAGKLSRSTSCVWRWVWDVPFNNRTYTA